MNKKYTVSINLGGIANRLKCFISLWIIADKTKRSLILYWPINHTCGAKFKDLFENQVNEISKDEVGKLKKKDFDYYGGDSLIILESIKKYIVSSNWKWSFLKSSLSKNKKPIDFNFENIPFEIRSEILFYLKKLKPLKKIKEAVLKFDKQNKLKDCIGVHIRRGDFADKQISPGRVSTDEGFIQRMDGLIKEDSKTRFFLCTDSKEMEEKIEKAFPKRIIKFSKTSFVRTDTQATQEGLIDLLLLSKTKHILGTYRSTFNELAWWFGECKPKMEIIINENKLKEYLDNTKKEERKIIPKIKRLILRSIGRKFL